MNNKLSNEEAINIDSVENIPKGGVVINCKNKEASKRIHSEVTSKLGYEYTVSISKKRNPQIKVTNISETKTDDEIKH